MKYPVLSQTQKDEILQHFKNKGVKECPSCKEDNLTVTDEQVSLSYVEMKGIPNTPINPVINPHISFECSNCGYLLIYKTTSKFDRDTNELIFL